MTRRIRLLRGDGEKVSINPDNPFLVLQKKEFSQPYKYRSIVGTNSGLYEDLPYMEGMAIAFGLLRDDFV